MSSGSALSMLDDDLVTRILSQPNTMTQVRMGMMVSWRLFHLVWHRSLWPAIAFSQDQCDTDHALNTHVSDTLSGGHVSSDQGQSLILLSPE